MNPYITKQFMNWNMINEIANMDFKDGDYKIETKNKNFEFQTYFTVNDLIYLFGADVKNEKEFAIGFYPIKGRKESTTDIFKLLKLKTPLGKVWGGVKKSMHDFIKIKHPKAFYFSSDIPEMIKFYNNMIKRIEKEFKSYKLIKNIPSKKVTVWYFEKKNNK